jgi:methyl-accepting chemotaxis protein
VTGVTRSLLDRSRGEGAVERNIPAIFASISPGVRLALRENPGARIEELIEIGIENNVWRSVEDLLRRSPATRRLVREGRVKVVGGIYDVGTGAVRWLPQEAPGRILASIDAQEREAIAREVAVESEQRAPLMEAGERVVEQTGGRALVDREPRSMAEWASLLGTSGRFRAPEASGVYRAPFGVEAAEITPVRVDRLETDDSTPVIFWALTLAALLGTLVAADWFATIKPRDGGSKRAFTLGSKLTLAFGSLTVLILGVSAVAVSMQDSAARSSIAHIDASARAQLLGAARQELSRAEIEAMRFLGSRDEAALRAYTQRIGTALSSLGAKMGDEAPASRRDDAVADASAVLRGRVEAFDRMLVRAVDRSDRRVGVIEGHLEPTAGRLTLLLRAVVETAHDAKQTDEAFAGAEALGHLASARLSARRAFAGSSEEAETALIELDRVLAKLDELQDMASNPTRSAWVREAQVGCEFYRERLTTAIELVREAEIVERELATIGGSVEDEGRELVLAAMERERSLRSEADAAVAQMRSVTVAAGAFAGAIAIMVGMVVVRRVASRMSHALGAAQAIAEGDLAGEDRIDLGSDEIGELTRLSDMIRSRLHELVLEVKGVSRSVADAAVEIRTTAEEMSGDAREQSDHASGVMAALEGMSASINEVARRSGEASESSRESWRAAGESGEAVRETIAGMQGLTESMSASSEAVRELARRGEHISEIAGVIHDIADQTNLLALNAAIEAARSGEEGNGVSTVAEEVRKLADLIAEATKEIAQTIEAMQEETRVAVERIASGVSQVDEHVSKVTLAGASLDRLASGTEGVAEMARSIAVSAESQSAASNEISRGVLSLSGAAARTRKCAGESARTARSLSRRADALLSLVDGFNVRH